MGSPDQARYVNTDEDADVNVDIVRDDFDDSRKHSSSNYRKPGTCEEDFDELDRHENRKRLSCRADGDGDDDDARKESRSKQFKNKNTEDFDTLDDLSTSYQDVEEEESDGKERKNRWESGRGKRRRWDEPDDSAKDGEGSDMRSGRSDSRENELNGESLQQRTKRDEDITWKRRQEKEPYDNMRDWELPRRGRDRNDGRRKDGSSRTEAVKTSSKYGISSENYDVIEIQTKPFDHGNVNQAKPRSDLEDFTYSKKERNNAHSDDQQQQLWRDDDDDYRADGPISNRGSGGPHENSFQGRGNNRVGRVGRGRPGIPMPHFRPPPGPMPPSNMSPSLVVPPPNMSPAPGMFLTPFQPPPIVWPGPRFSVPPPNIGIGNHQSMGGGGTVFSPPDRGILMGPHAVRPLQTQDKVSPGGWVVPPPRANNNAPPGKAPSRGEQNDYSQNFVDTGMRPQNFIRELELTSVVEDYPKLRELIQKKDEIVAKSASPPMYYKCDLKEQVLSPDFFGTKFDVILVDPPWEEYVHRAPGVSDHMDYWTFEEIMNLKIEAIADTPSFIFLWVGDGVGLEQGRQCLKKWGFRRCEDICWVKTNKTNATPGLRHDSHTLFQRSKEHCLMGIKGTVRRSTDGHIIHANIDTDVIIAEEPPYGSTAKPEDMYRIIEHFALGRRRLELFGEDHNIRTGWLTVGKGLSTSNFNEEVYVRNFADKDGNVWSGGGGRNPPPEAPHLVLTTPEIEALRPKSPMKNQQQSASISLTTTGNTRPSPSMNNQEASSSSNIITSSPAPWGASDDHNNRMFVDMYAYNPQFGGDYRGMNML